MLPRKRPRRGAIWCSKRCTNRTTSPRNSSTKDSSRRFPRRPASNRRRFDSKAPYFTACLRQQLLERYGAAKAFFGGLKVKSTLDLQLQEAAEEAVTSYLGYLPATASVVVIDNRNAGDQGDGRRPRLRNETVQPRHPGPSPARLLDQAVHAGHRARRGDLAGHRLRIGARRNSTSASTARKPSSSTTTRTPTSAPARSNARRPTRTTRSTPSSALEGLKARRSRTAPARSRRRSTRPATTTRSRPTRRWSSAGSRKASRPLGWAYAYTTIGNDGDRVSGTLAPGPGDSPVAYTEVTDKDGHADQGRRQRLDPRPGIRAGNGRRSEEDPRNRRHQRHRRPRPDRRRRPVGQDRRRPRTTATPGSAAGSPTKSPPASGSATPTRRRR